MKIGIDIDGVILDYQRVLNTYGDLYDFIELKKDGIVSKNELYLRKKYNWTDEERMNFVNKYFLKLSKQTHLIPGAKDVINMLKNEKNELIIISARGGMIKEMKDVTDKTTYQITFNLTKTDGEWTIDDITDADRQKLHGLY